MDPTVIVALIRAAGDLWGKVIERASGEDKKAAAKAKEVVGTTYTNLKGNLTGGCVRVLMLLESGDKRPQEIRSHQYPSLKLSYNDMEKFDREFNYRLQYLRLHGLVTGIAGQVYSITQLGQAFLAEARIRHDYHDDLFGS